MSSRTSSKACNMASASFVPHVQTFLRASSSVTYGPLPAIRFSATSRRHTSNCREPFGNTGQITPSPCANSALPPSRYAAPTDCTSVGSKANWSDWLEHRGQTNMKPVSFYCRSDTRRGHWDGDDQRECEFKIASISARSSVLRCHPAAVTLLITCSAFFAPVITEQTLGCASSQACASSLMPRL